MSMPRLLNRRSHPDRDVEKVRGHQQWWRCLSAPGKPAPAADMLTAERIAAQVLVFAWLTRDLLGARGDAFVRQASVRRTPHLSRRGHCTCRAPRFMRAPKALLHSALGSVRRTHRDRCP